MIVSALLREIKIRMQLWTRIEVFCRILNRADRGPCRSQFSLLFVCLFVYLLSILVNQFQPFSKLHFAPILTAMWHIKRTYTWIWSGQNKELGTVGEILFYKRKTNISFRMGIRDDRKVPLMWKHTLSHPYYCKMTAKSSDESTNSS